MSITELVVQLIELNKYNKKTQKYVFCCLETTRPWQIHPSITRKTHKRIYVPLPNKKTREAIIYKMFHRHYVDLSLENMKTCIC